MSKIAELSKSIESENKKKSIKKSNGAKIGCSDTLHRHKITKKHYILHRHILKSHLTKITHSKILRERTKCFYTEFILKEAKLSNEQNSRIIKKYRSRK